LNVVYVQVAGADLLVMGRSMMFGSIICQIIRARSIVDQKLARLRSILDPVEVHVNGLRSALFNGVVDESDAISFVDLDQDRALRVVKFG